MRRFPLGKAQAGRAGRVLPALPLAWQPLSFPRLRMVETLSNLLRSVVALSPPDLLPILYLSLNCLGPPQQGLELGVGDGVLLKAVAQATGEDGLWRMLDGRELGEGREAGGSEMMERDSEGSECRGPGGTDWLG